MASDRDTNGSAWEGRSNIASFPGSLVADIVSRNHVTHSPIFLLTFSAYSLWSSFSCTKTTYNHLLHLTRYVPHIQAHSCLPHAEEKMNPGYKASSYTSYVASDDKLYEASSMYAISTIISVCPGEGRAFTQIPHQGHKFQQSIRSNF